MNAYHCDASFDEITLATDGRIFTYTEKPVIQFLGTKPTQGMVGTQIKMPVINVTSSQPLANNGLPIITVTCNGEAVALANMAFTPQAAGVYVVTVTAEDVWGNSADPQTWEITVGEKSGEETGGNKTDGEGKSNRGLVIGLSVGGGVRAAGLAGGIIYVLIRKKKLEK